MMTSSVASLDHPAPREQHAWEGVELELCNGSDPPTIIEELTAHGDDDEEEGSNAESSTAEELDLMMMKYFSKGSFVEESGASLQNVGENINETIARIELAGSTVGQTLSDQQEGDEDDDEDGEDNGDIVATTLQSSSSLSAGITRHTISVNQLQAKPSASSSDEILKSASQPLESLAARLPSVFPYISPTPSMELLTAPVSTILATPQPSRQSSKQAMSDALEAPPSAGYGMSVWMAALRRDAVKKQQEQEQQNKESSSSASDASSLDSDEELEQWALQIRSEIRQTEMMELAMEAEKAAELGHERFSCHPSTYGSMEEQDPAEDKIEAVQSFPCPTKQASSKTLGSLSERCSSVPSNGLRRVKLRRHHTYSVGEGRRSTTAAPSSPFQTTPSSIVVTPRLGSRTKKRLRVVALRNIDEVIPTMADLHMHLQTHLHLAGVDTSSIDPSLLTPYDGSSLSPKSPQDGRSTVGSNVSDGSISRIGFLKKFAGWVSATASKDSGIVETPSKDDDSLEVMIDDSLDSDDAFDVGNTLADHNTQLSHSDGVPSIRVPKGLVLPDDDYDEFDIESQPFRRKKPAQKDIGDGDILSGSGNTELTSKTTSTSLSSTLASTTHNGGSGGESSTEAGVAPPFLTPVLLSFSEAAAKAANGERPVGNLDLPDFTPMTPEGPVHSYPRSDAGAQQQPPSPSMLDLPNLFITPIRLRGFRERRSGMQSVGRSNLSWQQHSVANRSLKTLNDSFLIERRTTENDDAGDADDEVDRSKSNSGGGLESRRHRRPKLQARSHSVGDLMVGGSRERPMQSPEFNVEDLDTNRSLPEAVQLPLALRQLAPPSILPSESNLSERGDNKELSPHLQKAAVGGAQGKKDLSKLFHGMKISDIADRGKDAEGQPSLMTGVEASPLAELVLPALAVDVDQATGNLSSVETTPITDRGTANPATCAGEPPGDSGSPEQDDGDSVYAAKIDHVSEKQLIPELAESRDEDATTPVDIRCRESECSSHVETEGFETADILASILNDKVSPLVEPNKSREISGCDGRGSADSSVEGSNIVVNLEASFVESSVLEISRVSAVSSLEKSYNVDTPGPPARTTPESLEVWKATANPVVAIEEPPRNQESPNEASIVCETPPEPNAEMSAALVERHTSLDNWECAATFDCKPSSQLHHRRNQTAVEVLDAFSACSPQHRRVTSCPDLADPALLGVDEPLASPMSPSSVEEIKRSAEKKSRLEGAGCMSDMSHSESLAAAMEVFGRLSPPAKRREVEIDEKVNRALAISQQENHEFLKNFLFCSKQPEEESVEVASNRDAARFCAAEACGPNSENLGDFCATFASLMSSASSLFPLSSSSHQTGRHLIGLNAGNPYAHAEPDTWLEAATEKFDGAIERWVGRGSNQNHYQNSNFEAPSHAMKTPQSARRKTMAAETPRGSNVASKQPTSVRRQPARLPDLTDKQFQLIYGMTREEYEERSASGSQRSSLSQNPSWGSAAPTLSESKSWRSQTGSTSSAPCPPPDLQVPRSHSNLSADRSPSPTCLDTPT